MITDLGCLHIALEVFNNSCSVAGARADGTDPSNTYKLSLKIIILFILGVVHDVTQIWAIFKPLTYRHSLYY